MKVRPPTLPSNIQDEIEAPPICWNPKGNCSFAVQFTPTKIVHIIFVIYLVILYQIKNQKIHFVILLFIFSIKNKNESGCN